MSHPKAGPWHLQLSFEGRVPDDLSQSVRTDRLLHFSALLHRCLPGLHGEPSAEAHGGPVVDLSCHFQAPNRKAVNTAHHSCAGHTSDPHPERSSSLQVFSTPTTSAPRRIFRLGEKQQLKICRDDVPSLPQMGTSWDPPFLDGMENQQRPR